MKKEESFLSRLSFKCFEKFIFFIVKVFCNPKVYFEKETEKGRPTLDGPTIILSNHINHLDGTVISYVFRKYSPHNMAAKDRFEQGGLMKWYLTKGKCIPIDRKTLSTDWLRAAVRTLSLDKENIAIYPEGRHGSNRQILPFHSGVTTIAAMTGCPIVMVYIDGPYKFGKRCRLIVSEPLHLDPMTEGMNADYIGGQTEKLHTKMEQLQASLLKRL
ncbi:MAG: 1-acyl-sn-glycerol-3-phosphate acyltransferase [Bacteroidales bacterium]|nr:1-acyl-sn-glycerol-3-phosphate acyltransferase [Candidatus Cacconaster merdequi]